MSFRTLWLVLAVACLAGCQAGATKDAASSKPAKASSSRYAKYDDYEATAPFKRRMEDMQVKLTETIMRRCAGKYPKEAMYACLREALMTAFDTHGVVEEHCPEEGTIEDQYACIMLGAYGYEFVRRLGDEEPKINWADPEVSMNDAAVTYTTQSLRKCLGGSSASDPTECVVEGISKKLGLSREEIEPCRVIEDDYDFGRCVGEAFGLRFMEEGIARM